MKDFIKAGGVMTDLFLVIMLRKNKENKGTGHLPTGGDLGLTCLEIVVSEHSVKTLVSKTGLKALPQSDEIEVYKTPETGKAEDNRSEFEPVQPTAFSH